MHKKLKDASIDRYIIGHDQNSKKIKPQVCGSWLANHIILVSNRIPLTSKLRSFWGTLIPNLRGYIYVGRIHSLGPRRSDILVCPLKSAKMRM